MEAYKSHAETNLGPITEYVIIKRDTTENYVRVVWAVSQQSGETNYNLHETLQRDTDAFEYMNEDEGEWEEISDDLANYVLFRAGQSYDLPYSLADESTSPYAWALDGASPEALEAHLDDGGIADEWANEYVRNTVLGAYSGDLSTEQVMDMLDDAGELHEFVEYVISYAAEHFPSFPSLTQRVLSAPVVEALEVTLDMIEGTEEDGGVIPSFDDNGGLADGNVLLTTDYTMAQRDTLIERGATIRRVAKLGYLWRDQQVTLKSSQAHKDELELSSFRWCGMQVAGEALVIVTGIADVSVPPTAMSKTVSSFRHAVSALRTVSSSVEQSIGNGYFGSLSELAARLMDQAEETPGAACFINANGFRYVTSGNLEYGIVRDGDQYVAFINHPRQWHYFSTLFASAWLAGFRPMGGVPYHYDDYTARAVMAVSKLTLASVRHTLVSEAPDAARMLVAHIAGVLKQEDDAYKARVAARAAEEEAHRKAIDDKESTWREFDPMDDGEKFLGTSTLAKIRGRNPFDPKDDE